jgi:hypothetical protein
MKGSLGRVALYALGGALIFGAVYAYYAHIWGTYYNFNLAIEFCELRYCDFVLYYYEQAKVILESHAPIVKYFYSPSFALLIWPFSKLSKSDATDAWGYLQAASLALYVGSALALLKKQAWWSHAVMFLLTITCYPILHNWKWGQANTLFVGLAMLSLVIQHRAPAPLTALPIALAAAGRYFPIIYAVGFLGARRWKLWIWVAVLTAALLVGLPVVTMGPQATVDFYRASAEASRLATTTWVVTSASSHFPPTVLARMLPSLGTPFARSVLTGLCYAVVAANLWRVLRAERLRPETRLPYVFGFIAGCTPLLLPTSWIHYLAYLPVTQAFLLDRIVHWPQPVWARAALGLGAWLPSVVFANVVFFNQFDPYEGYAAGGWLLWANLLMLAMAHALARWDLQPAVSRAPAGLHAAPSST